MRDIIHCDDLGRVSNRDIDAPAFEERFDLVFVPYEDYPYTFLCSENRTFDYFAGCGVAPHGIDGDERHARYDDEMTSRPL